MQVGDKVKMSDVGKKHYTNSKFNPFNLNGVVNNKSSSLNIKVEWSNGEKNSYEPKELELVEPKQEQYYTSIPTDVKIGDKFEVIGLTRIDGSRSTSSTNTIGEIVSYKAPDGTCSPLFLKENGSTAYLNWGWLKPVKEDYKVGDWVLLIDKNFNSHVSDMNKFKGTIQQIDYINEYNDNVFYLKGDSRMWAFVSSDFVKKVDAPVTQCKLVDVPSQTLIVKTTTSTDVQQFSIGDEVELIDRASGYQVYADVGSTGKILSIEGEQIKVAFKSSNQSCKACQIKLINNKTTNNNAKSNSNNKSIIFPSITSTISTGSTPRGIVIQSSGEKISLGY